MAKNMPGLKRGFHWDPAAQDLGIYVNGTQVQSYSERAGRTYYVNLTTGSSTGSGLSWGDAFDEVSTAITASEAYRELGGGAPTVTTNDYVRNTIIVQATEYTEYGELTDLGEYVNIIGLGNPSGGRNYSGKGIVQIGSATAGGMVGPDSSSGDFMGVYIANIQFLSGDPSPCFQVRKLYNSTIEDCGFWVRYGATSVPAAGIRIIDNAESCTIRRCHWGTSNALTDRMTVGLSIEGTHFAGNIVEDCVIGGSRGICVRSTLTTGFASVVRHNMIGNLGHGPMVTGIQDLSTKTANTGGLITYYMNFIDATDPMEITNDFTRCIMNYADNAVLTS